MKTFYFDDPITIGPKGSGGPALASFFASASICPLYYTPDSGAKADIAGLPRWAKELVWGDLCQDYSLWAHLLVRPGCDISSSRPVFR
jgi:hypothetical protein